MKREYRLYLLPLDESGLRIAVAERFSRITSKYVLVYSENQIEKSVEITEKDLKRLSSAEKDWLFECNIAIIAEETERNAPNIIKMMSEKLDLLDEELGKMDDLSEQEVMDDGES